MLASGQVQLMDLVKTIIIESLVSYNLNYQPAVKVKILKTLGRKVVFFLLSV